MSDESETGAPRWRVDKRLPVATLAGLVGVITTLAIQIGYVAWWAASVQAAISSFAARIDAIERQAALLGEQAVKIGVIEVKVQATQDSIKELKDMMRERVPVQPRDR